MRGMKPAEIRSSPLRPVDPTMTPTFSSITDFNEHLTLNHKVRKPLVEKLRRERINSSIEQLKSLLSPELLKQQPDSKMEKADVLEMTVCFLTQLMQQNQTQRRLLNHFDQRQASSDQSLREADLSPLSSAVQTRIIKDKNPEETTLWRPW